METNQLKELINKANEATKDIKDEEIKKIAFKTALDKLLDEGAGTTKAKTLSNRSPLKQKSKSGIYSKKAVDYVDDETKDILKRINRTKYTEIHNFKTAKDQALYLLSAIKDDLKIDGLNPSQISIILTKVFRIKSNLPAISMALGQETKYVDREEVNVKGGRAYSYKIMHTGEQYIKKAIEGFKNKK